MKNRSRPCLDYEMKRCLAPCSGRVSQEDYNLLVKQIESFFAGQGEQVSKELESAMNAAALREEFELAAALRDRMLALKHTLENQRVETEGGDMDAWGLYQDATALRLGLVRMRAGQMIASQVQDVSQAALEADEALSQGLLTFYHENNPPPPLLLLSQMPADGSLVSDYLAALRQSRVEIRIPQRGEKRGFLDLALRNAAAGSGESGKASPETVLAGLERRLELNELNRMECMDISHLGGTLTVASVVCFAAGRPLRSAYRRYPLSDIPPGDDYAAISQAVARRLNSRRPWPDLMVIDGGKGQLAMALAALEAFEQQNRQALPLSRKIIALAKGREEKESDKVYLPGRKNPLPFPPRDAGLAMLMALRDEAHRVALGYQRLLRKKSATRSILEEIPGLGPQGRQKINQAFASIKELKNAAPEEISRKTGLNLSLAQKIVEFLRPR
jgi:excinuclease ABC subunit C